MTAMAVVDLETAEALRLDKWLVHARFCKTRTVATTLITKKRIRINREVVSKASRLVRVGDVLTLPRGRDVVVIRVLGMGERRGPPAEARLLYDELSPADESAPQARRN